MAVRLLDTGACLARLKRMSFEIYERNFERKTFFLWGIDVRGYAIAQLLGEHLTHISGKKVFVFPLQRLEQDDGINDSSAFFSQPLPDFDRHEAVFIVVDDVLYTGGTLFKAVNALFPYAPNQLQVAVLIDRGHHHLPIHAQYIGLELATTLQEYITVEIDENENRIEAFLL